MENKDIKVMAYLMEKNTDKLVLDLGEFNAEEFLKNKMWLISDYEDKYYVMAFIIIDGRHYKVETNNFLRLKESIEVTIKEKQKNDRK